MWCCQVELAGLQVELWPKAGKNRFRLTTGDAVVAIETETADELEGWLQALADRLGATQRPTQRIFGRDICAAHSIRTWCSW